MGKAFIWVGIGLIAAAFIVGSTRGKAGAKLDAENETAAEDFLAYKTYTTQAGLTAGMQSALGRYDSKIIAAGIKNVQPLSVLSQIVKDISSARGGKAYGLGDDETKVYSALKRLNSLVDLYWMNQEFWYYITALNSGLSSSIATSMMPKYKTNVIDFIAEFMTGNDELAKANDILKKLPAFIYDNKKYFIPAKT